MGWVKTMLMTNSIDSEKIDEIFTKLIIVIHNFHPSTQGSCVSSTNRCFALEQINMQDCVFVFVIVYVFEQFVIEECED